MLDTFPKTFPKRQFPKGVIPSGNFPTLQFPKRQLTKYVLAASLGHLPALAPVLDPLACPSHSAWTLMQPVAPQKV